MADYREIIEYMAGEDRVLFEPNHQHETYVDKFQDPRWLLKCRLEGLGGHFINPQVLADELGIKLNVCISYLENCVGGLVQDFREGEKNHIFYGLAPPLEPTPEGLAEAAKLRPITDLGRQAEMDFYEQSQRGQQKNKVHK